MQELYTGTIYRNYKQELYTGTINRNYIQELYTGTPNSDIRNYVLYTVGGM